MPFRERIFSFLFIFFFKSSVGGLVRHILSTETSLIETTNLLIEESGVLGPFYRVVAGSIFASKVLAKDKTCAEIPPPPAQIQIQPDRLLPAGWGEAVELQQCCFSAYGRKQKVGESALNKAGDSKQARLSTRSSLGANYISSVH